MTQDTLDAHHERQFILLAILAMAILARLGLVVFGLVPWSGLILLAIGLGPLASLAWLVNLGSEETT